MLGLEDVIGFEDIIGLEDIIGFEDMLGVVSVTCRFSVISANNSLNLK